MKPTGIISVLCLAGLLPLVLPKAAPARWTVTPRIYGEVQYDDNILLSTEDPKEDLITSIAPGIKVTHQSPTDDLNLDYQFKASFFREESDLDYTANSVRYDARKDISQRLGVGIRGIFNQSEDPVDFIGLITFERPSFRRGERSPYMRNVVRPFGILRFGERSFIRLQYTNYLLRNDDERYADQDGHAISGLLNYRLNIRNGFEVFYLHQDVEYGETVPPSPNRDFYGDEVRGRYTYFIDRRTSVFVEYRLYNRNFDQQSPGFFDYMVHDPQVGFSYDILESLSFSLSAGYALRTADGQDNEGAFSGRTDLSGQYKRLTVDVYGETGFDYDFVTAEALGFYEFYRTGVRLLYPLLEKLLAEGYFFIERDDHQNIDLADRILSGRASLTYEILEWLFVSFDYQHIERSSSDSFRSFNDNRYFGRVTIEHDLLGGPAEGQGPRRSTR